MVQLKGEIVIKWKKGIDKMTFLEELRINFPESGIGDKDSISVYKSNSKQWFLGSIKQGDAVFKTKCGKYIVLPKSCF